MLQQVIAYLRRQAGLASRTCLSWDYQFYCSRLCRRECVGSGFLLSLSLFLSSPLSLSLFLSKKEILFPGFVPLSPRSPHCWRNLPTSSLYLPEKIAPTLLTIFLLSLFPIETEKTAGPKERHCCSFPRRENSSSFVLHSRALHFIPPNMRPAG